MLEWDGVRLTPPTQRQALVVVAFLPHLLISDLSPTFLACLPHYRGRQLPHPSGLLLRLRGLARLAGARSTAPPWETDLGAVISLLPFPPPVGCPRGCLSVYPGVVRGN